MGKKKKKTSVKKKEKSKGSLYCRHIVGRYFKIQTPELKVRATSGKCPGAIGLGLDHHSGPTLAQNSQW